MSQYRRSGDHSFHPVTEVHGEAVKHNGSFTFGVGEASNHNHVITVKKAADMKVYRTSTGEFYFELFDDGMLTHVVGDSGQTADHKPITIKKGIYKQVREREVDIFSHTVRRVID